MELDQERRKRAITAIQGFFADQRDEEIGDLGAALLLDRMIEVLGPPIYNQALSDAQSWFASRLEELEVDFSQLVKPKDLR